MIKALLKSESQSIWKELTYVVGGVILLLAASKIFIPLKPVPITLQPTAVLLLALTYSSRRALQSVLLWIGMGAAGLPVFAGWEPGLAILVGPTAGYIYSYVFIAALIPHLRERLNSQGWFFDMALCGIATIMTFAMGVAWLSTFVGFDKAVTFGLMPFIIPGIVKAGILCSALKAIRSYRTR
ncbi:Biotin transporter BioY [Candidatus Bealeia paramacronuclearis]|uniref:Biotin transporter n=1 Tax=Candidatus Bealeia paramacronuclearis TaxID=1921001 RepID=A0ABZ2C8F8_9PROT|nr:Biotin transporter BioY [Candidatus Bealeia paramacronuclearis]